MFNGLLDSNSEINVQFFIDKKWKCRIIPESLSMMEVEWLADAINKLNIKGLILLYFEYGQTPSKVILNKVNRDTLLTLFSEHSYHYLVLTSIDLQFLYFKEQGNKYSLEFGNEEFVRNAYKCTYETHKLIFLDYAKDVAHQKGEQNNLLKIWEKYDLANRL